MNMNYTSKELSVGQVYTRDDLRKLFDIVDTTLNTGVFKPAGTNSIWLFVTENKPSDRTPYLDLLSGDTLQWQGQMKGRTDRYIINHQHDSLEILVFYRTRKYEHPGAGFRYEGQFAYRTHEGSFPTSFTLQRVGSVDSVISFQKHLEQAGEFDPADITQGEDKVMASIARRRGQVAFRNSLMNSYAGCCAVTGCDIAGILEAAHIIPYQGRETNHVQNGILLRADIHTLFDLHMLTIDPNTYNIILSPALLSSEYVYLSGKPLRVPDTDNDKPSRKALSAHRSKCAY